MAAPYAQIITHTPEQAAQWKLIAASNPARLVRVLTLAPGRKTRDGDTQADIYPAIEVVRDFSKEGQNGTESAAWIGLVNEGLADALCQNVCEMVTFLHALPDMPKELLEQVLKEIRSPYFRPLEVLCNAACCFHNPLTPTDRKILNALRKNWAQMMERVWKEPENTLEPHDSHISERMVIAQLVIKLITNDPPFISTFYDPSDLTVQIIARHWKYATHPLDTQLTASVLSGLVQPEHPRHIAYVRSNDLESALPQILNKLFTGAAPLNAISKPKQAKALLAGFTDHIGRLTGGLAKNELLFLSALTKAVKHDTEPELVRAVLAHAPLWNAMFRLLKKSAKASPQGPWDQSTGETEFNGRAMIVQCIVGLAANTIHGAMFDNFRECEPLARMWANEGFFGAFEETIDLIVQIPGMPMQLTRIGTVLHKVITTAAPATRQLYRAQFPRWRLLGALVIHDMKRQTAAGRPPEVVPGVLAPYDSNAWDHGVWQMFGSLHYLCFDPDTRCARRGCEKTGKGKVECQCKSARYCGEVCREKDSKDHNLVCGYMTVVNDICRKGPGAPGHAPTGRAPMPAMAMPLKPATLGLEDLD
ncbi:hypothetical protein DXG01_001527 [Tephrocybe rancida]|nr:hypothetical protein DXG01_001527 [Tephrocybe rancida]